MPVHVAGTIGNPAEIEESDMTNLTPRARAIARRRVEQEIDRRIENAYRKTCVNVTIDIMDISKVFHQGRKLLANGADEAALADGIRAFVDTIRKN